MLLLQPGLCCLLFLSTIVNSQTVLEVSTQSLDILQEENATVTLYLRSAGSYAMLEDEVVVVHFDYDNTGIITLIPDQTLSLTTNNITVTINPLRAGHVTVSTNTSDTTVRVSDAYFRVDVMKSRAVELLSTIIGWTYFVAWSISFWPQIWENFRRKSVIGLNFDYVYLNIVGHSVYGAFNVGLFWVKTIQDEYKTEHPYGVIPVQANDVFFSIHAVIACAVVLTQTIIYEKGQQKVSLVCWALLGAILLFLGSSLIATLAGGISWLLLLNFCSYVKLGITLVKYMPQAFMNYRRKSTVGWSIGNILLDFTGGVLSMLQMFLIGYNNDDWDSIFGDFTKFGLGLISVLFDVVFIVQHYWLYRGNSPHEELTEEGRLDEDDRRTPSPTPPAEDIVY